jgi:hypothetical protein
MMQNSKNFEPVSRPESNISYTKVIYITPQDSRSGTSRRVREIPFNKLDITAQRSPIN